MGLLDSLAGQVIGSLTHPNGDQHSALMDVIAGLLTNQPGGLAGLIASFDKQGLGEVIASWVGTGQNQAISAEQVQAVLGNEYVQSIAQKLGFSTQELSAQLAQLLPQVVDKLTPGGTVPESNALGGLLDMFKSAAG